MRIAISAAGTGLDDKIDPRFGRCRYFLIVDPSNNDVETIDNEDNLNRSGGAGIQAAERVVSNGAGAIITGHCGPKAFSALQAADVKVYSCPEGTVRQALERYRKSELPELMEADAAGR